jgi:hypothetical protein
MTQQPFALKKEKKKRKFYQHRKKNQMIITFAILSTLYVHQNGDVERN